MGILEYGPGLAAVLVFVVAIWGRLDDRSALRKLERLVEVKKAFERDSNDKPEPSTKLPAGTNSAPRPDAAGSIDRAISNLASKVEEREKPKPVDSQLTNYAAVFVGILLVGAAVYSELVRLEIEIPYWGVIVFLVVAVIGGLGILCVAIVILIWMAKILTAGVRRLKAKFGPK